jgi:protein involved in polysaccharide export with SLBB domain
VYVYGAVKTPGVLELPPTGQVTVMQLISEMGGLTSWADPDRAYILRQRNEEDDSERIPVNLTELFSESARQIFVPLEPGDIFFVPGIDGNTQQVMTTDESEIIVVGEVNSPGIILFAPGEQRTVMRAIFKAAGFTKFAKSKEVRLIRYGKDGSRSEQTINVSAVIDDGFLDQDVDLLPGDMLIVPQKMINF